MNFGAIAGLALAAFVATPVVFLRLLELDTSSLPTTVGAVMAQAPMLYLTAAFAMAAGLVVGVGVWFGKSMARG